MHPLTQNLNSLKDEELNQKFADLQKRLSQCYRLGPASAIPQIQMLLADYQTEISLRNRKIMEEMNKKVNDAGIKGIIDIQ
jgi:hypothetical protein